MLAELASATVNRTPLSITRIDTEEAFLALSAAWGELLASLDAPAIFLTHEWFDAAWQWAKYDSEAWLLAIWQDQALIGVLPLMRRRTPYRGISLRKLEFLSVPDTQLCDLIAAPTRAEAIAQSVAGYLVEQKEAWDILDLRLLPVDSMAARYLVPALRSVGMRTQLQALGENPWIDLSQGWDHFYASRSRSLKKKNNLINNRLRKAGTIDIEWLRPSPADTTGYAAGLETVIDISAKSWKQNTGNSLDQPGPQAFIQRLSQHAAQRGWLSIWLLKLNGQPMAMEYQLADAQHVYALRADYDSACAQDLSPGSYLNMHLLEQQFQAGFLQYCMGPGDNPYKYRWADRAHALHQLTAYSPSIKGRMLGVLELSIKPHLRRWLKPQANPGATKEVQE